MATCGYLCPQCEGKGFTEDGTVCDWCLIPSEKKENTGSTPELTDEEWIAHVHGKCACSDIGEEEV